jgi:hypothetical protein
VKDTPIVSVWCADCTAERRHGYRLGIVQKIAGIYLWLPMDYQLLRGFKHRYINTSDEWFIRADGILELTPSPEMLPAWCQRHGEGSVSASDIYGRHGNLVAKLVKATA